jgi:hypothetical protein
MEKTQNNPIISLPFVESVNNNWYKTDDNKIVNEKHIRWVKKMSECLIICTKSIGCNVDSNVDTHKICKINNLDSYNKLNKHFE